MAEFAPRRASAESRRNVDRWLADAGLQATPRLADARADDLVAITRAPEPEPAPVATPPPAPPAGAPSLWERWRRPLGFLLAAVGLLLLIEFGLTIVWKEPISALRAAGGQSDLDKRLARLERQSGPSADGKPISLSRAASDFRKGAKEGDPVGRLWIPDLDVKQVVVAGTNPSDLEKGPGYYSTSPYPGERGTVAVAGHRTTFTAPFRHLDDVKPGDNIRLHTPYGRFVYRVTKREVVDPSEAKVLQSTGARRLVLTTCHPLFSQAQRLVVVAKQTLALPA